MFHSSTPLSTPLLHALEIRKSFFYPARVDVLKGVSLEVYGGQSLAIMGASGEGKSTLLQILGTLEAPSEGSLSIVGQVVTKKNAAYLRNHHIGFIFQAFNLLEDYTAFQNVLMPALIAGKDVRKGSMAYLQALELLDRVGLSHRAHFSTKLLSGGEKQRAAIARALCNDPSVLLADEPSGNLDKETSRMIHELLLHCARDLKKALIVVTHDPQLAALCDSQVHLAQGFLTGKHSCI